MELVHKNYESTKYETEGGEIKIYNYRNKRHIDKLVHYVRRHPLDFKTKIYGDLGHDIFIHSTPVRVLLNSYIANVLDEYGISAAGKRKLIFTSDYSSGKPGAYMNLVLDTILEEHIKDEEIFLSHILADIKSCFTMMTIIVNGVVSKDHSLLDYLEAYEHVPEFRAVFETPAAKPSDHPWHQEKVLNTKMKEFESGKIIVHPATDFFRSKTKLNVDQFKMMLQYGPIPYWERMTEVRGSIMCGILNGITSAWELFALDQISRLAIITGKNDVKVTGTQSKRMSIVLCDTKLNRADTREMIDDCHNKDYYVIHINSSKDLSFFRFKYYYDPETHTRLGYIDKHRADLIGKTLYIRTFSTCKGDVICKECYGYNWRFACDTKLFKGNINVDVLQALNALLQKVISIKHHAAAKLKRVRVQWGDVDMDFADFIDNSGVFSSWDFDKFTVADNHTVQFDNQIIYDKRNKPHQHTVMYIDGKEFITGQKIFAIDEKTFKMVIPNDSVISKADELRVAINAHSNEGGDFDDSFLKSGASVAEQMQYIIDYLRRKINLDHFVYYEALAYSLVKDADDPSSRVTEDTTKLIFTHADHALQRPERSKKISTKLPHGYINNVLNSVSMASEPDETDILYQNIGDRKIRNKNVASEFNNIINKKHSGVSGDELAEEKIYLELGTDDED